MGLAFLGDVVYNVYMAILTVQNNNLAISSIQAREILDSRGTPTLECALTLSNGVMVVTSISTANLEKNNGFHELRDRDQGRMLGLGVIKAVDIINTRLAQALMGRNPIDQEGIDELLVTADITVFTRCKRQVLSNQVGQFLVLDMIACLITVADDGIVLAT